jgi:DNA-binding transcriptional LysR family regulator
MDRLTGLTAFVRTSDFGSFVAAARVLGLSPSAVGKAVTRLEDQMGVRLFQRSTRSLRLTEEGRVFHKQCREILDALNDAQDTLRQTRAYPSGRVRLTCPIIAYHLLVPIIPDFLSAYPDINLELDFNDRMADLIEEGVDIAIRSGSPPDSRLMMRVLRPFRLLLCASPAYLERHGVPRRPRDLHRHVGVAFRHPNTGKRLPWPLCQTGEDVDVHIRDVVTCNNMEALHGAVLRGVGIGCIPDFVAVPSIRSGALVPVLVEFLDAPGQFNLIWPSSRHLSPKVRVLVEFLVERLSGKECALPEEVTLAEDRG